MSLQVDGSLLEKAMLQGVSDEDLVGCVETSLPFAHDHIMGVINRAKDSHEGWAYHEPDQITEEQRGQMLRAYASTAIRNAYERIFGVTLVFQNCHRGAAFLTEKSRFNRAAYEVFVSPRTQVLAQSPEKVHC